MRQMRDQMTRCITASSSLFKRINRFVLGDMLYCPKTCAMLSVCFCQKCEENGRWWCPQRMKESNTRWYESDLCRVITFNSTYVQRTWPGTWRKASLCSYSWTFSARVLCKSVDVAIEDVRVMISKQTSMDVISLVKQLMTKIYRRGFGILWWKDGNIPIFVSEEGGAAAFFVAKPLSSIRAHIPLLISLLSKTTL